MTKTAIDLFKECADIVNTTYPKAAEAERLTATIALVGLSIQAAATKVSTISELRQPKG